MQLAHWAETVVEKSAVLHLNNAVTHVRRPASLHTIKAVLQGHQLAVVDEL
jgi:hypothetical protein